MKTRKGLSVKQIDIETGEILAVYPSIKEAGRKTNTIESSIRKCLEGYYKKAGGFKWETT